MGAESIAGEWRVTGRFMGWRVGGKCGERWRLAPYSLMSTGLHDSSVLQP